MAKKRGRELPVISRNRITEELSRAGISQKDAVARLQRKYPDFYSETSFSAIMNGRRTITRGHLEELALFLGVRYDYLIGKSNYRTDREEEDAWDDKQLDRAVDEYDMEHAGLCELLYKLGYSFVWRGNSYHVKTPEGRELDVPLERFRRAEAMAADLAAVAFRNICE